MPDTQTLLRQAGFNDDEIGAYLTDQRTKLQGAGFKDNEIDQYFGFPKTPAEVPPSVMGRLANGTKLAAAVTGLPDAITDMPTEAWRTTVENLKGIKDTLLPKSLGGEREPSQESTLESGKQLGSAMLQIAAFPFSPIQGALRSLIGHPMVATDEAMRRGAVALYGEAKVAEAEKATGRTPGGMTYEDAKRNVDTALMALSSRSMQRVEFSPTGEPQITPVGDLPKGEDISNAGNVLTNGDTTPSVEEKLGKLYEEKGIHPSEVAHDAQTDPTITQSMVSADKEDLPTGYKAPPPTEPPPTATGGEPPGKPPEYSDAEKQILSKISIGEKAPERALTFDRLYTNFIDKLFPISKAVKEAGVDLPTEDNPYHLARLLTGYVGKADHFLNNGTFDFNTYENNGKSLKEILNTPLPGSNMAVADDLNGFRAYATAARALELEGRGIKSGFAETEPSAPPLVSSGLDAARTVVAEGKAKFEKPLRELVDYQNRVSGYLRDSGVLSDAGYKAMVEANKMYVPFSRVMGLEEGAPHKAGSTLQAHNPVKAIKGSARDIIDPIESIVRNTYHMIEMAEKNVVGTKLVDMLRNASAELPEAPSVAEAMDVKSTPRSEAIADALGEMMPELKVPKKGSNRAPVDDLADALAHASEPMREGEIAILRDGKRETYKVDPDLARAMKGLDAQSMGMLEKVLAYPASVLRAGAVLTPDFAIRHTIRDFLYATTTFKGGVFHPLDMAKGFTGLIMKDEDYWNWLKGGGGNVSFVGMDRQYLQADLQKLTADTGLVGRAWNVLTDPDASMWDKTGALGKLPFQAINKFVLDPLRVMTTFAESASHLAAFKKGMRAAERAPEQPDNLRAQILQSAWQSRDTAVDAARMGASMRAYNMITAFANIKLQDSDRVIRAIKDNPIKTLTSIGGAITVPSMILWALNHDDPDYQELPQWEKDLFFIVPVGSAAPSPLHISQAQERGEQPKNSAAFFMRIPKPWAMGLIFGSLPERLMDAFHDQKPGAFKGFFESIYQTAGPDFVPTAAAPIIDQFANRSTFTNRTLIPAEQEKFLPEYQYTPYTTELTKSLGKVIGAFPGMSTLKMENSGFGGTAKALTSPILMENYIRGWSGTLGNYALQAADAALRKTGALPDPVLPTSTLADIPIIKSFVARYPAATTESIQNFRDEYSVNKAYFDTFMAKARDGDVVATQHIADMGGPMMFAQLDGINSVLTEHSQLIRDIYKNDSIPAPEKRQLVDQLYFSMIQVARYGDKAMQELKAKAAIQAATLH